MVTLNLNSNFRSLFVERTQKFSFRKKIKLEENILNRFALDSWRITLL